MMPRATLDEKSVGVRQGSPDELKLQALEVRGDKARAKILYRTPYPTPQQVKNVPAILRHFKRTRRKSE